MTCWASTSLYLSASGFAAGTYCHDPDVADTRLQSPSLREFLIHATCHLGVAIVIRVETVDGHPLGVPLDPP